MVYAVMTCRVIVHQTNVLCVVSDLCISSSSLGLALAVLCRCNLGSYSTSTHTGVFKVSVQGHRSGPANARLLKPYCSGLFSTCNCVLGLMSSYDDNQVLTLYGKAALHKY